MLPDEDKRVLSNLRYEHALECLRAADALFASGDLKGAANRAYYAVFHAMRSVLLSMILTASIILPLSRNFAAAMSKPESLIEYGPN